MKTVFFELEPWEENYLKERLKDVELSFFDVPLSLENIGSASGAEIISPFIYSEINKDILEKLSIIEICNFYDSVIVFSDKKSKICTSCYIEKNLLEFNKSSIMFDGHKSLCRKCTSEKGKIYYEKNKIERI